LLAIEEEAKRKGCKTIVLDTFSFQAEGFYRKLIEEQIGGYDRIYLRKEIIH
jgi:hypothetical protein